MSGWLLLSREKRPKNDQKWGWAAKWWPDKTRLSQIGGRGRREGGVQIENFIHSEFFPYQRLSKVGWLWLSTLEVVKCLVLVPDAGGRLGQHRVDVVDRCHLWRSRWSWWRWSWSWWYWWLVWCGGDNFERCGFCCSCTTSEVWEIWCSVHLTGFWSLSWI